MNFFDEASLRLKQALKVTTDKEASALLGLSPVAWVGRKNRENFPIKEVFALAAQRPDLGLDADWIVTGTSTHSETQGKAEQALLEHYRLMSPQMAKMFLKIAATMSGAAEMSGDEISRRLAASAKTKQP